MNTVRAHCCQTLRALVAGCLWALPGGLVAQGVERSPAPPTWQQEIDAARLLEGSLALVPTKDAADQGARHIRLQELYRGLARRYPDAAAPQKAAADYFARDGQPAAAFPFWDAAARIDRHDGETADRFGGAWLQLGRAREAYQQFQKAVDAQPNVSSYHTDLANVLYLFRHDLMSPPMPGLPDDQAALTQALAHFHRAAELAPEDAELARAYAETFYIFARPDWAQALAAWETVLVLSGEKSDLPNSHLARISLRLGRPDDAARYLARINDPSFDALKAKLLHQADQQREAARKR